MKQALGLIALLLFACSKNEQGPQGPPGSMGPPGATQLVQRGLAEWSDRRGRRVYRDQSG